MATTSTVSSLGVGSGLDLNSLLQKLMTVEQQPLELNKQRQAGVQAKISAYGSISSKLSTLQSAANALKSSLSQEAYAATSSDATIATATTSVGAATGSYAVHIANLAAAHTLNSKAFAATSTVVGTGTLRIGVGASTFDVSIGATNNTLAGIRDAINTASNNTGVNATIITDTLGSRLALTSKNTGAANTISVAVQETGTADFTQAGGDAANLDNASGLSQLAYVTGAATNLTQAQSAADASLTINGIPVSSASNTLTTAISGVSLTLTKAGDTTIAVNRDQAALTKLDTNFTAAYNDLQSTVRNLTNYDASAKKGNVLNGEGTARALLGTLSRALNTVPATVTGTYDTLSDLGISVAKDGSLAVDTTKLQTAISTDFTSVKSVFTGYGTAISSAIDGLTGTTGALTGRINGLNASIKLPGKQADSINLRLTAVAARYRKQFTSLDTLVAQMQNVGTYLSQQLSRL